MRLATPPAAPDAAAAPFSDLAPDVQALAGAYPGYVASLARNRRWNFAANILDSGTFALTSAALTETTILPYFVSQMTANAFIIGLSPAIAWLGQYVPQLFGAYLVHSSPQRKPYIVRMAWLQRVGILAMLLAALAIGRLPNGLVLAGFLLIYWAFWTTLGLLVPAYANFYAKHIPSGRGRFLGVQALLYGGLGVVSAAIVQRLLTGAAFPKNFVYVLAYALITALPALIAFHSLREVPFPIEAPRQTWGQYLRETWPVLRARPAFCRFLSVRAVMVLGKMSVPFLALYALQRFNLNPGMVAVYTACMLAAQSVSAPVWGYLSDRLSPHKVWGMAALAQVLYTGLALWAPRPIWFLLIFALIGVVLGAEATAQPHTTYLLAPAEETTRFIGLTNTSLGPLLSLGPLAGGALISWFSYPAALGASAGLAVAGLLAVGAWTLAERGQPLRAGGGHV
jgi:MFS family permease